jgi:hypothetical protein
MIIPAPNLRQSPYSMQIHRSALRDLLARGNAPLPGFGQGDAVVSIAAQRHSLAPAIQTVVVTEGDLAGGRHRRVHTVTIGNLVYFIFWFQSLDGNVGQHNGNRFERK